MSNSAQNENVASGVAGKIVGKAKEAVGRVIGHGDLSREGRLQQALAFALSAVVQARASQIPGPPR